MNKPFVPRKNSPEKDLVMTPEYLAEDIMNHFRPTGKVLDPCKGEGAFLNLMPPNSDWCEISDGVDFMSLFGEYDWIVTNPPWSKMRDFINKGMDVADNVVYLTTINHYTTKARMRDIFSNGFGIKEIYCVPTPDKPWPQLGFQLAAIHIQKGWDGPTTISWSPLTSSLVKFYSCPTPHAPN